MTPYLFILGLVIFWAYLEKITLNRKAFWVPLLLLSIFAGVRSNRVGTDSGAYTSLFQSKLNTEYYKFSADVEVGYQYFEYFLLKFTYQYYWLFLITSFIICLCYLIIIKRFSRDYIFSIFLFVTLGFYTFFFNGLRQGMAMAVCFLALPYLINKNKLKYFFLIIIASLFHTSAWIMLPFYFLVHIRFRLEYKILITFLSSFLISGLLISYLAEENSRYEGYAQVSESSGGYILLIFYFILGLSVYFLGKKERFLNHNYKIFEQLYLCGLFFMIPIALLGTNPSGPQRILNYFTPMLIFLIPILISKFKTNFVLYIFSILMIIFFYLTTSRFSNLTPYALNPIFEVFK